RNSDWASAHRGIVSSISLGTVVLNIYLIGVSPKGFFPQQDTGGSMGGVRADQSISFTDSQDKMTRITRIVKSDPAVATVVAFAGGSRAGGGFSFATLKPRSQRPPAQEVIARLRPKLGRVRGVSSFLNPVQDLQAGGRQTNSTYQYVSKADSPDTSKAAGQKSVDALQTHPDLITHVDTDPPAAGA
ncbi:hypothetical protein OY671_010015, partial [Metschnikowia pulcherrima]